ncbi:hypothetical protein HU200_025649 [Digitaria exilis]|uniref:Eukaryotic translation initiation factor 3 subunit K n=1 Tax=Digitaria exilis TaxID=1010633 RepID=A0A835EV77_9POAL|nr:hypothetical protein HU200_025649 [Digitaria exilis]
MATEQAAENYTVEDLVALNPYNPDILNDLEKFVNEQVSSQTYNLDANLSLLRLYQFEPERMSIQIVARILIKALMAMPAPDFSLCLFLIPEHVIDLTNVSDVQHAVLLPSVFVATFFYVRSLNCFESILSSLVYTFVVANGGAIQDIDSSFSLPGGFEQAIQTYAIHLLSLTYQKVPRPVLAEAINIEGLALDKFLEYHAANSGWVIEKGGQSQVIVLPRNEFNHPELKKNTADSVPFEHVTRIFPVLS